MRLSISDICEFAEVSPSTRNFVEAESALNAGHLSFCGRSSEEAVNFDIIAFCIQTSNPQDAPHEIRGTIDQDGKILHMKCSCKAELCGNQCKHVISVLLHCSRNDMDKLESVSCTDTKNLWGKSQKKSLEENVPYPILEHDCYQHQINLNKATIQLTAEQEDFMKMKILTMNPDSTLAKHMIGRSTTLNKNKEKSNKQ